MRQRLLIFACLWTTASSLFAQPSIQELSRLTAQFNQVVRTQASQNDWRKLLLEVEPLLKSIRQEDTEGKTRLRVAVLAARIHFRLDGGRGVSRIVFDEAEFVGKHPELLDEPSIEKRRRNQIDMYRFAVNLN